MTRLRLTLAILLISPHGWCCATVSTLRTILRVEGVKATQTLPVSRVAGAENSCCCCRLAENTKEQDPAEENTIPHNSPGSPRPESPCCCTTTPASAILNPIVDFDPSPPAACIEFVRCGNRVRPVFRKERNRRISESPPRHIRLCVWLC